MHITVMILPDVGINPITPKCRMDVQTKMFTFITSLTIPLGYYAYP